MDRRLPNLFIVGAPRCGTNFLYFSLRRHPEVFMAPTKEPHFFCRNRFLPAPQAAVADEAAYLSLFAGAAGERWIGEASPSYLYEPSVPAAIRDFAEDPRIMVTVRHPADLMFSMYWLRSQHALHRGIPYPATFGAALAAAAAGAPSPDHQPALSYRETATLAGHVERYVAVFGRERVHVIVYDDLAAGPAAVRAGVCAFLGIDPAAPQTSAKGDRPAASEWVRSRALARWLWRPPETARRIARALLPAPMRDAVRGTLRRLNVGPPRRIDPALRRRLSLEFEPEIRRLGTVIGRDLGHWLADRPAPAPGGGR
ncbi:MAG TPA: sulfotransferase [Gemmatimonadales bacterium]